MHQVYDIHRYLSICNSGVKKKTNQQFVAYLLNSIVLKRKAISDKHRDKKNFAATNIIGDYKQEITGTRNGNRLPS